MERGGCGKLVYTTTILLSFDKTERPNVESNKRRRPSHILKKQQQQKKKIIIIICIELKIFKKNVG